MLAPRVIGASPGDRFGLLGIPDWLLGFGRRRRRWGGLRATLFLVAGQRP